MSENEFKFYDPVKECKSQLNQYKSLITFTLHNDIFAVTLNKTDTKIVIKPISNGFLKDYKVYESVEAILMEEKEFQSKFQAELLQKLSL